MSATKAGEQAGPNGKPTLARTLTLPLAILFGLGVTIGAGIYVLIGAAAGRAGMHAPIAFVIAALVMLPTAASFAELVTRLPVSAGEAEYVRVGFNSRSLALAVGLMVIAVGVLSAAAISHGSAGYLSALIGIKASQLLPVIVLAMGLITAWGIKESVSLAAVMTVIEIAGLVAIVLVGGWSSSDVFTRLPEAWSGLSSLPVISGVLGASLLAFFAFIGFESLANIAEEVKEPERLLPKAIFWTLLLSTILYIAVVWVALVLVPREELAAAKAPLSLVFERATHAPAVIITIVAVVATLNGIIAQLVMASRVAYGLAERGELPSFLAQVNPTTQTPLHATVAATFAALVAAIALPIEPLAEATSRLSLIVFALVNVALLLIKLRPAPATGFVVPIGVPILGAALCGLLLLVDALGALGFGI